jgi:ferredoxin
MDEMIQPRNKELFNKSACSQCGDCLHLCPELNLPINFAKEEKYHVIGHLSFLLSRIKRLIYSMETFLSKLS